MPRIPPCALCRRITEVVNDNKKPFLIYSIFYLLIIEIVSLFLANNENYACYWFPLLTNTGFFLLTFSICLWNEKLHFCQRKKQATKFLASYYLFGTVAILLNISDSNYTFWISIGLLSISGLIFILSIFRKK